MRIAFLAKEKPFANEAAELVRRHEPQAEIVFGKLGEAFPKYLRTRAFDYVISYISPWIIPKEVLVNTTRAAINLHPGPPKYPGIGCTNFAIYDGTKEFGITVHHMKEKVDSGNIIMVERFPIFSGDTVFSLSQRCYAHIYTAFVKLFSFIVNNQPLPKSEEQWTRQPFTRKQLDELCKITVDMSEEEVRRRVRATNFPGAPGAYIEIGGQRFEYTESQL